LDFWGGENFFFFLGFFFFFFFCFFFFLGGGGGGGEETPHIKWMNQPCMLSAIRLENQWRWELIPGQVSLAAAHRPAGKSGDLASSFPACRIAGPGQSSWSESRHPCLPGCLCHQPSYWSMHMS